jgi:hypothetical protein
MVEATVVAPSLLCHDKRQIRVDTLVIFDPSTANFFNSEVVSQLLWLANDGKVAGTAPAFG